jgi:hypothetical protein
MKKIVRLALSTLPLATLVACGGTAAPAPTAPSPATALETLSGTYADGPNGYSYGKAFGKRVFTFDRGKWTLEFTLALDPELATKVFSFRTHGTYTVEGPSAKVPGAYDATFREDKKYLTLLTPDAGLAKGFGFDACALQVGVEKDVSVEGCLGWKPVAVCGADYDLLALTPEGGVRFGVRPANNDMCTPDRRPTELTPPVMPRG